MTPPELSCPDDVAAEALPDRHYALINVTAPASTGRREAARAKVIIMNEWSECSLGSHCDGEKAGRPD